MDDTNGMESMITSAVFLLKKYVRTKRNQIADALREEEKALIEPSQALIATLEDAQEMVETLDSHVKSLDTTFKMLDKRIRDKLTMATIQQSMLRARRNKEVGHLMSPHNLLLIRDSDLNQNGQAPVRLPLAGEPDRALPGRHVPIVGVAGSPCASDVLPAADFRCPFCVSRPYSGKPPLLRHISDSHPERYQVFEYIVSLTPESVFNSNEIGGSSQCHYCAFRERSKAPLLRHIQENHTDQYEFFVKIARLKGVKVPLNRPISQSSSLSRETLQLFNSQSSQQPLATTPVQTPVQTQSSAINTKTTNNARKTLQTVPADGPFQEPLSTPTQSNQPYEVTERTDHEYSIRKRNTPPPPEQLQPQNKVKRTRRFQAEQNKSRYMCSKCGEKFAQKNGIQLHEKFYCEKRDTLVSPTLLMTTACKSEPAKNVHVPAVDSRSTLLPADCTSPTPSSSSNSELLSVSTRSDSSAYAATVRDLDVRVPDMRQDDIVVLMRSMRFKQILGLARK